VHLIKLMHYIREGPLPGQLSLHIITDVCSTLPKWAESNFLSKSHVDELLPIVHLISTVPCNSWRSKLY